MAEAVSHCYPYGETQSGSLHVLNYTHKSLESRAFCEYNLKHEQSGETDRSGCKAVAGEEVSTVSEDRPGAEIGELTAKVQGVSSSGDHLQSLNRATCPLALQMAESQLNRKCECQHIIDNVESKHMHFGAMEIGDFEKAKKSVEA